MRPFCDNKRFPTEWLEARHIIRRTWQWRSMRGIWDSIYLVTRRFPADVNRLTPRWCETSCTGCQYSYRITGMCSAIAPNGTTARGVTRCTSLGCILSSIDPRHPDVDWRELVTLSRDNLQYYSLSSATFKKQLRTFLLRQLVATAHLWQCCRLIFCANLCLLFLLILLLFFFALGT